MIAASYMTAPFACRPLAGSSPPRVLAISQGRLLLDWNDLCTGESYISILSEILDDPEGNGKSGLNEGRK
jgi:hypothetical protein